MTKPDMKTHNDCSCCLPPNCAWCGKLVYPRDGIVNKVQGYHGEMPVHRKCEKGIECTPEYMR